MLMRHVLRSILLLMIAAATGAAAVAQTPPLAQKVLEAYREIGSYQSTISYSTVYQQGRWTRTRKAEVYLSFDRPSNRLKLDRPGIAVASDGSSLVLTAEEIQGRFLRTPLERLPLDYDGLIGMLLPLRDPVFPDLVLLIDDSPWQTLAESRVPTFQELPAETSGLKGLRINGSTGMWDLWVDPRTYRVIQAEHTLDPVANQLPAGDSLVERFEIQVKRDNQPLEPAALALDTQGMTETTTVEAFVNGPGAAPAPGQAGPGQASDPMVGRPAPDFELPLLDGGTYKLGEGKPRVVVLDFWATWCGPCHIGLLELHKLVDWTQAQGWGVAYYAVNLMEDPALAEKYWKARGLTIPVLLDQQGTVAQAYGVPPLPRTVLVVDGKIAYAHSGYSPQNDQALRDAIRKAAGE